MNLWPVEHFFPHFLAGSLMWGKNCSTGQKFICTEVTSYKIHTLASNITQDVTLPIHTVMNFSAHGKSGNINSTLIPFIKTISEDTGKVINTKYYKKKSLDRLSS